MALIVFLLMYSLISNPSTTIQYLLTAELLGISLYSLAILFGFLFDDSNLLSFTLFFLVLSAVEISIGFILIAFQSIVLNSSLIIDSKSSNYQFISRFTARLNIATFLH